MKKIQRQYVLQLKSWIPGSSSDKVVEPFSVQLVGVAETNIKVTNIRIIEEEDKVCKKTSRTKCDAYTLT